ncbi:HAMP domain-containing sensor histidine kinase [Streptomyces sp. 4N509B]|uniref:HAMP domain-containing sensor histidine kinase n=1 Tax=Streptomyces sp. 4N509B TaxID=3457413 RepID=UPI003FD1A1C4
MTGPRARFAALPLRSRLALLTAVAVALAVAVCATVAWFVVRGQLLTSLDGQLREGAPEAVPVERAVRDGLCREEPADLPDDRLTPFPSNTLQVVDVRGNRCILSGSVLLETSEADLAVAARRGTASFHNAEGTDGVTYRVYTQHVGGTPGLAVSVARPLTEVNDPLRSLALVLALVAAAGVVGAAGVGVPLARAGLRPVNRLTEAAEHIARTEDLSVRLPVPASRGGGDGRDGGDGGGGAADDEIARLSRAFNAMTAALASSRELQQQLIADAGHELRTPLTSLRTNIELLARSERLGRPLPEEDRLPLLASVRDQMAELTALVGDLQELSRPAAAPGRFEVVGLHEVTARALRRVRPRAGGVPLDAELEPWFVRAEPAALERAVVNLLDNAVKFGALGGAAGGGPPEGAAGGAAGGGVRVLLRDGVLRVRDHGPGIAPSDLPHVFERFWRSEDARALPGSGLGLSIVARTVAACGGRVVLRPAPGGGTEAELSLPGAPVPPPAAGDGGTGGPAAGAGEWD